MSCMLCADRKHIFDPESGDDLCPCPNCLPAEYDEWFRHHYTGFTIRGWQREAQKYTHAKLGHWLKNTDQVPLAFCYLYSEISENFDKWRDEKHLGEDFADLALRLFQTAEDLHIDLEYEMVKKMRINWARPQKHGRKRIV